MAASQKSRRKPPTPAATRLLLVRHGEVEARYQKKFGGWIDMNLSPNGKRQAKVLANYLRSKTIEAIYASPMKRVQQTVAPTLKLNGHKQTIMDGLREINFGDWSGLGWQEVEELFQFRSHEWLDQIHYQGCPTARAVRLSAGAWSLLTCEIIAKHRGQNVAIFCHGGVIRMILSILIKLPLPKSNHFDIVFAGNTQVALHPHIA